MEAAYRKRWKCNSTRAFGRLAPLLLGLWLPLLGGCGGDHEVLIRQMEELKRELAQLKASSAQGTVTMEDMRNRILLLEDQVDSNQILLSRVPVTEPSLPVVRLSPPQATASPTRQEGGEGPAPSEAARQGRVEMVQLQQITELGEVIPAPDAIGSPEAEPAVKSAGPGRRSFDGRPVELYQHAYQLLQEKRHQEALVEFDRFLGQYPEHDYSDNALYWMGEAHYDIQEYERALTCFERVVTLYPRGNKVPDAMLKSALCHASMGQTATARELLTGVAARYPATRAAIIARQRLEAL